MTKVLNAPLHPDEFDRRLRAVEELRDRARDAYRAATGTLLAFANEYAALYREVARDVERVTRLNQALDLDDFAATRLRTIAAMSTRLTAIQDHLPPSLEPLYEVTLALKHDEPNVVRAIDSNELTPDSTLRDIRTMRKRGIRSSREPLRKPARSLPKPTSAAKFINLLKRATPAGSLVVGDLDIDKQDYGTTIVGRFIITNVRPKNGSLPDKLPPSMAKQLRKVYGVVENDSSPLVR